MGAASEEPLPEAIVLRNSVDHLSMAAIDFANRWGVIVGDTPMRATEINTHLDKVRQEVAESRGLVDLKVSLTDHAIHWVAELTIEDLEPRLVPLSSIHREDLDIQGIQSMLDTLCSMSYDETTISGLTVNVGCILDSTTLVEDAVRDCRYCRDHIVLQYVSYRTGKPRFGFSVLVDGRRLIFESDWLRDS